MFPGTRIGDPSPIASAIDARLNPSGLPWFEVKKTWRAVDLQSENIDEILPPVMPGLQYYVLYTHLVHRFKDKAFLADRREVLEFIAGTFNQIRGEGTDVTIAVTDLSRILVCNHDGDIFIAV